MGILDNIMGVPNPTGMTPQEQMQMLKNAPQITTGQPSYVAPQQSFMGKLGSNVMDYLKDPANRAQMAAAFNTMRLNPDPNVAKFAENQQALSLLKTQGNKTADALEAAGQKQLADLVRADPSLAKTALTALYKNPTGFEQKYAAAKAAYPNLTDAQIMDKILAPSSSMSISLGGDDALTKEYAKQIPEALKSFTDRGQSSTRQLSALNRVGAALSGVDTGGLAETKRSIMTLADRLGIPVDENALTDAQQIQAFSAQLIAEELRQNKGPQTDFDAMFAERYFPSLGKTPKANQEILSYLRSRTLLDSMIGRLASTRPYSYEGDKELLTKINRLSNTVGGVISIGGGQFMTFEQFVDQFKKANVANEDILLQWERAHLEALGQ